VIEGLASELSLTAPAAPWHSARDSMAEFASFLGLLSGSLGKIATDVGLMAQSGISELFEPYEPGRGGSSTLPHKRNPIGAVYTIAAARAAQALVPQMQSAMLVDHERATGPWQTEALALGQCATLTHGALAHMRFVCAGMQPDVARMRANLDETRGLIMTEAVSMALAPTLGRAEAHHAVKTASDRVIAEGIDLGAALAGVPEVAAVLSPAAIAALVEPASYLGSTDAFIDRVVAAATALN